MPEFIVGFKKRKGIAWRKSGLYVHPPDEDQWDNFATLPPIQGLNQKQAGVVDTTTVSRSSEASEIKQKPSSNPESSLPVLGIQSISELRTECLLQPQRHRRRRRQAARSNAGMCHNNADSTADLTSQINLSSHQNSSFDDLIHEMVSRKTSAVVSLMESSSLGLRNADHERKTGLVKGEINTADSVVPHQEAHLYLSDDHNPSQFCNDTCPNPKQHSPNEAHIGSLVDNGKEYSKSCPLGVQTETKEGPLCLNGANKESSVKEETSFMPSPFCQECIDKKGLGLHHSLCPLREHSDKSGAAHRSIELQSGLKIGCQSLQVDYVTGEPTRRSHFRVWGRYTNGQQRRTEADRMQSTSGLAISSNEPEASSNRLGDHNTAEEKTASLMAASLSVEKTLARIFQKDQPRVATLETKNASQESSQLFCEESTSNNNSSKPPCDDRNPSHPNKPDYIHESGEKPGSSGSRGCITKGQGNSDIYENSNTANKHTLERPTAFNPCDGENMLQWSVSGSMKRKTLNVKTVGCKSRIMGPAGTDRDPDVDEIEDPDPKNKRSRLDEQNSKHLILRNQMGSVARGDDKSTLPPDRSTLSEKGNCSALLDTLQELRFLDQYLFLEQTRISKIVVRDEMRMYENLGAAYGECGGRYWRTKPDALIEFSLSDTSEVNQLCWEAALFDYLNELQDEVRFPQPIDVRRYKNVVVLNAELDKEVSVLGSLAQVLNIHSTFGEGAIPEALVGWLVLEMFRIVRSLHKVGIAHNYLGLDSFLVVSDGIVWTLLLTGLGTKASILIAEDLTSHFHHDMLSVAFVVWSLLTGCAPFRISNKDGKVHLQGMHVIAANIYLRGRIGWTHLLEALINPASGSQGIEALNEVLIRSIGPIAQMRPTYEMEYGSGNSICSFWNSLMHLKLKFSCNITDDKKFCTTLGLSSEELLLSLHFGHDFPCQLIDPITDQSESGSSAESQSPLAFQPSIEQINSIEDSNELEGELPQMTKIVAPCDEAKAAQLTLENASRTSVQSHTIIPGSTGACRKETSDSQLPTVVSRVTSLNASSDKAPTLEPRGLSIRDLIGLRNDSQCTTSAARMLDQPNYIDTSMKSDESTMESASQATARPLRANLSVDMGMAVCKPPTSNIDTASTGFTVEHGIGSPCSISEQGANTRKKLATSAAVESCRTKGELDPFSPQVATITRPISLICDSVVDTCLETEEPSTLATDVPNVARCEIHEGARSDQATMQGNLGATSSTVHTKESLRESFPPSTRLASDECVSKMVDLSNASEHPDRNSFIDVGRLQDDSVCTTSATGTDSHVERIATTSVIVPTQSLPIADLMTTIQSSGELAQSKADMSTSLAKSSTSEPGEASAISKSGLMKDSKCSIIEAATKSKSDVVASTFATIESSLPVGESVMKTHPVVTPIQPSDSVLNSEGRPASESYGPLIVDKCDVHNGSAKSIAPPTVNYGVMINARAKGQCDQDSITNSSGTQTSSESVIAKITLSNPTHQAYSHVHKRSEVETMASTFKLLDTIGFRSDSASQALIERCSSYSHTSSSSTNGKEAKSLRAHHGTSSRVVKFIPARLKCGTSNSSRRLRSSMDDSRVSRRSSRTILSCGMKGCKSQFPVNDGYMWVMMLSFEEQAKRQKSKSFQVVPTHDPMHLVCLTCVKPNADAAFMAEELFENRSEKSQWKDYLYYKATRLEYEKWIRK